LRPNCICPNTRCSTCFREAEPTAPQESSNISMRTPPIVSPT
jgi:hypothetical protein